MKEFVILSLFPGFFDSPLAHSMLKRGIEAGLFEVTVRNMRDWATDRHRTTDDYPFGGGSGLVMKPEPIVRAIDDLDPGRRFHRVLLSPAGRLLTDDVVRELAGIERLMLVCGHYEGVDERVAELAIDRELSIGDFVLTGGEPAALCLLDAVVRHIPGVLHNELSTAEESFAGGLLEYPHYTRPQEFSGLSVPEVLLSGHHAEIARWRRRQRLLRTRERRPDLWARLELDPVDRRLLDEES